MKKASKRRILFAARMATMVGAACFAVSGISETLGQEKEKSRPVYIATEEVAETTYTPEVEEATQPTETAKAVETEESRECRKCHKGNNQRTGSQNQPTSRSQGR